MCKQCFIIYPYSAEDAIKRNKKYNSVKNKSDINTKIDSEFLQNQIKEKDLEIEKLKKNQLPSKSIIFIDYLVDVLKLLIVIGGTVVSAMFMYFAYSFIFR